MKFDLEAVNEIVYPDAFQPRQFDVLRLKLRGYSNKEVAEELFLSPRTIRDKIQEIKWIIGLSFQDRGKYSHKALFKWAIENDLIEVRV